MNDRSIAHIKTFITIETISDVSKRKIVNEKTLTFLIVESSSNSLSSFEFLNVPEERTKSTFFILLAFFFRERYELLKWKS